MLLKYLPSITHDSSKPHLFLASLEHISWELHASYQESLRACTVFLYPYPMTSWKYALKPPYYYQLRKALPSHGFPRKQQVHPPFSAAACCCETHTLLLCRLSMTKQKIKQDSENKVSLYGVLSKELYYCFDPDSLLDKRKGICNSYNGCNLRLWLVIMPWQEAVTLLFSTTLSSSYLWIITFMTFCINSLYHGTDPPYEADKRQGCEENHISLLSCWVVQKNVWFLPFQTFNKPHS